MQSLENVETLLLYDELAVPAHQVHSYREHVSERSTDDQVVIMLQYLASEITPSSLKGLGFIQAHRLGTEERLHLDCYIRLTRNLGGLDAATTYTESGAREAAEQPFLLTSRNRFTSKTQ